MSLSALGELLRLELGRRVRDLDAQVRRELLQVHGLEQFTDRLRPDGRGEAVLPVFVLGAKIFLFGQQLTVLQRREPRLQHDVVFEIENPLEVLERHIEQHADAARQRLQEPDMRHRRGELDMAHPLAPNPRQRHLDAAFFANNALVLHALVLAAQALIVLDGPENTRAEQAVALRLERPIIDRLGLLDLADRTRTGFCRGWRSKS